MPKQKNIAAPAAAPVVKDDTVELVLLTPEKARDGYEVTIPIGGGQAVIGRREDMSALIVQGKVPMPLLAAVQKMTEDQTLTDEERITTLGEENGNALIKVMREHAVRAIIKPKVAMDSDEDGRQIPIPADCVPVTYFDVQQLMAIWVATAVVPRFTPQQAGKFRLRAVEPPAPAPQPRTPVSPPTEHVGGVDLVTG